MKIVKSNITNPYWGYGLNIETPYIKPHFYIDCKPEYIEVKIYTPTTGDVPAQILYWQKINLSVLKNIPGFGDQSIWTTFDNLKIEEANGVQVCLETRNNHLVDIFAKTLISKSSATDNSSGYNHTPFVIYVGDSSGNFNDYTLVLKLNSDDEFVFEGPSAPDVAASTETVQFARNLLPSITLSSTDSTVAPDQSITINVTTDASVKEVYLEQVYGLLNKTRVSLSNGVGSFNVLATGMNSGDTIRVKAGFKKYTGVADFTAIVS